tara:strand:+ start:1127 stop:1438 length:312 start_codon:yes stop_codon:yes gene_type:complete
VTVIKTFAWFFIAVAFGVAAFEIISSIEKGEYQIMALGEVWYQADKASLNTAQAIIQRYLFAWLWDPIIIFLLTLPAWAVLTVIGLLLFYFHRRSNKRRKFLC